jgi:hypothetical protein
VKNLPINVSFDVVAVDLNSNGTWTFARRISSSTGNLASVFTRLVFPGTAEKLDGGHYHLMKDGQISPDLLGLQWCPLTTLDGLRARIPISPDAFHSFNGGGQQPPAPQILAFQQMTPTRKGTDRPLNPALGLRGSAPTQEASTPTSRGPTPSPQNKPVDEQGAKPRIFKRPYLEFVSSDEEVTAVEEATDKEVVEEEATVVAGAAELVALAEAAARPRIQRLSFTDSVLSLLNTEPGVLILRHRCFMLKYAYYVGVSSNQKTAMQATARIQIDSATSIKIISVQPSLPPLAGLYMWIRKAKLVPNSWLPFPGDTNYELLTFEPSPHCLKVAFDHVHLSKRRTI